MITSAQIQWLAGFLEGEGSFTFAAGTVRVSAVQVQRWPLERCASIIGGRIRLITRKYRENSKPIHMWNLYSVNAAGLMMTLYSLLSPDRQLQIRNALRPWLKLRRVALPYRTHCPHGHSYSGANLYRDPDGARRCRRCDKDSQQRLRRRRNERLSPDLPMLSSAAEWAKVRGK